MRRLMLNEFKHYEETGEVGDDSPGRRSSRSMIPYRMTGYIQRTQHHLATLATALAIALCGCGGNSAHTASGRTELPSDWIGYRFGLQPPQLKEVGRATNFVQSTELPIIKRDPTHQPRRITERTNDLMAMGPDGRIYEVAFNKDDFRRLGEEMKRLGETDASSVESEPEKSAEPQHAASWSLGTDMRQRLSPSASVNFNRTGLLASRCTATLFGKRVVLTAFHCLWDGRGNWIGNINFAAGRDGTSVSPFGTINHTWKYWSQTFLDNGCHKWKIEGWGGDCAEYDWAIVVLAEPPKHKTEGWHPGWMGFAYNTDDDALESWALYNRGYPGCAEPEAPVGCITQTQWGQSPWCKAYDSGTLEFDHSCDTSAGHSGSALYSWTPGTKGPYIVGIHSSAYECKAPGCTDVDPATARRLTETLFDKMVYAKSVNP